MTITGTGFVPGAIVSFEGVLGTPSEVVTVQVVNSTTIIATVNVKGGLVSQAWDVRVTNPDLTTAILPDPDLSSLTRSEEDLSIRAMLKPVRSIQSP
jgi:hypothetical protein